MTDPRDVADGHHVSGPRHERPCERHAVQDVEGLSGGKPAEHSELGQGARVAATEERVRDQPHSFCPPLGGEQVFPRLVDEQRELDRGPGLEQRGHEASNVGLDPAHLGLEEDRVDSNPANRGAHHERRV